MTRRGFTLIELIITMLVLALLAIGVTSYIGLGARMYSDTAEREQILGQSRFVAERIVREVRNAAPNSVRVNTQAGVMSCLEFTPVAASGIYSQLPVAPESGTAVELQLFNWSSSLLNQPFVVYPTSSDDYYASSSARIMLAATVTNSADITSPANGATVKLTLSSAHSFPRHSPEQRFFILQSSVSYCVANNEIRRLTGHDFSAGMPAIGSGVLMAQGVTLAQFRVLPVILTRNASLNMLLQFGVAGSDMFFNYEVHLPNVP